jgi:putative acyl-CoA dehydrogenase
MTLLEPLPSLSSSRQSVGGPTHDVTNQVPPLVGHDVAADPALLEALEREGAGWHVDDLHRIGRRAGSEEARRWGDEANRFEPVLRTHDRYGHRVDEVDFHPSWHRLMDVAVSEGLAAATWRDDRPGAHVARAASFFVWGQVEAGHGCPVTMTYAVVPALRTTPELSASTSRCSPAASTTPGLRSPPASAAARRAWA